jgi:hypothetical protein
MYFLHTKEHMSILYVSYMIFFVHKLIYRKFLYGSDRKSS